MFRAVFIDDEPWALSGIMKIINWRSHGLLPVAGYTDGTEALARLSDDRPDVIFTDIRMPGMGGLELIERCRLSGYTPVFVVVSAFAEFEYARKAIEAGAFSYILKPFVPEDMEKTAVKISAQLHALLTKRLEHSINECVLSALQYNGSTPMDPALQAILNKAGEYRVCIKAIPLHHTGYAPHAKSGDLSFRVLADKRLAILSTNESVAEYDATSHKSAGTDAFSRLIREVFIAYYSKRFYGVSGCVSYHRSADADAFPGAYFSEILMERNLPRVKAELARYEQIARADIVMIDSLVLFYNSFLRGLYMQKSDREAEETIREFADCFELFGVFRCADTLFASLRILLDNFCAQENEIEPLDVIKSMSRYIDDNYADPITLEQLSERFHTSLFHLSRMFKRETGMTFTEYLTKKRLESACEMLNHTQLSVAEIGRRSGYADYFYFSKVFKKHLGVSPTGYRKGELSDDA